MHIAPFADINIQIKEKWTFCIQYENGCSLHVM